MQTIFPRNGLLTIYKSFIRPILNYADVIYDHTSNASFSKKIESVQYNLAVAITALAHALLLLLSLFQVGAK